MPSLGVSFLDDDRVTWEFRQEGNSVARSAKHLLGGTGIPGVRERRLIAVPITASGLQG